MFSCALLFDVKTLDFGSSARVCSLISQALSSVVACFYGFPLAWKNADSFFLNFPVYALQVAHSWLQNRSLCLGVHSFSLQDQSFIIASSEWQEWKRRSTSEFMAEIVTQWKVVTRRQRRRWRRQRKRWQRRRSRWRRRRRRRKRWRRRLTLLPSFLFIILNMELNQLIKYLLANLYSLKWYHFKGVQWLRPYRIPFPWFKILLFYSAILESPTKARLVCNSRVVGRK